MTKRVDIVAPSKLKRGKGRFAFWMFRKQEAVQPEESQRSPGGGPACQVLSRMSDGGLGGHLLLLQHSGSLIFKEDSVSCPDLKFYQQQCRQHQFEYKTERKLNNSC